MDSHGESRPAVPTVYASASPAPARRRIRSGLRWILANLEELVTAAQEDKILEQLKGYGMTAIEPDQVAFREAMKPLHEKYDSSWTKELREKIQAFK